MWLFYRYIKFIWFNQDKHNCYRRRDCIKKICEDLKKNVIKIINFKEKIPLTDEKIIYYEKQKLSHICKEEICYDKNKKKFKLYPKVRDHCYYTGKFREAADNICNLRYKVQREIPVVIQNGSKYNYNFTIKELAEEFKGQFECLGENTEKYITLSVLIRKEKKMAKQLHTK